VSASKPSPAKRILAVDDDATALDALRQILVSKGYDVTPAATGEEAVAIVEGGARFDLILLDVALPGLSGFDVCRRIREREDARDVPIIFLTAKGRLMDMAEGEDAGSDLYLVKPVLASKLLHMLGLFLTPDAPLAKRPRQYHKAG
jgi:two-component system sensor histidine kinase ChiS